MSSLESDSEEEIIVYAEMDDNIEIEKYRSFHVLGVDTKNPIIQMDDTFFMGKYDRALGTYLFFEEDPTAQTSDPLFDRVPENCLKYLHKTRKLIKCEQTYVVPKEGTDHEFRKCLQEKEDNFEIPHFSSLQNAIEKFKTDWGLNNAESSSYDSKQTTELVATTENNDESDCTSVKP